MHLNLETAEELADGGGGGGRELKSLLRRQQREPTSDGPHQNSHLWANPTKSP